MHRLINFKDHSTAAFTDAHVNSYIPKTYN